MQQRIHSMNDQTHKNNRDAIYEKHLTSRRQTKTRLLTIRIDVDYPYPSRLRSFIYTTLCLRAGKDYARAPFPRFISLSRLWKPCRKRIRNDTLRRLGVVDLREALIRLEHQVKRFVREMAIHQVASQGDYC
jgi:hypothetical protein